MKWENVYIFISSTFNDMHAERDYLVKNVFPELTEWCEQRKLRLIDIDLRWGITAADSENSNTVMKCLENVDTCRPFFICFLGQRRGWIPNDPLRFQYLQKKGELTPEQIKKKSLLELSDDSFNEYPDLKKYDGKNAVTEIEIEHALLSPMSRIVNESESEPDKVKHALFFLRKDPFGDELTNIQRVVYRNDEVLKYGGCVKETDDALAEFKQKIYADCAVTDYRCRWDKTIQTPELLTEENGEEKARGRLIDFRVDDDDLKKITTDRLKYDSHSEMLYRCGFQGICNNEG